MRNNKFAEFVRRQSANLDHHCGKYRIANLGRNWCPHPILETLHYLNDMGQLGSSYGSTDIGTWFKELLALNRCFHRCRGDHNGASNLRAEEILYLALTLHSVSDAKGYKMHDGMALI